MQTTSDERSTAADATSTEVTPAAAMAAAIEGMDWPTVRDILDRVTKREHVAARQAFELSALATDWVGVLRAEPGVLRDLGIERVEDLPPPMVRLAIQARHRLELFEDARDLSRTMRGRINRPEWARREAEALQNLGEYQAALSIGLTAWENKVEFAPLLIVRSLIAMDQLHRCKEFLEGAAKAFAANETPEKVRAKMAYYEAVGNHDEIASLLQGIRGRIPEHDYWTDMADIAARKLDFAALDGMLEMLAQWRDDPGSDALYRRAAPSMLQSHFKACVDWPRIEPLLAAVAERPLEPGAAATVSAVLLQVGDYQFADRVVRRTLEWFPSALTLWRRHLHVLSLMSIGDELVSARIRMRSFFPTESYLSAASIAEPRSWAAEEISELLEHNIGGKNKNRQGKFIASLTEADLSESQLEMLRAVALQGSPEVALQFDLMLATAKDSRLLEKAVLEPVDFSEFRKARAKIANRVSAFSAALSMDDPAGPPTAYGMSDCLAMTEVIQARGAKAALYTRETYSDATRVTGVFMRRIANKTPTSVIRLGDGEGQFMEGPPCAESYRDADRSQIQNIWWGSTRMVGAQLDEIVRDFRKAVAESDVLAMLPPWRFIAEMHKAEYTPVHRGIHSSIYHVYNMTSNNLIISMHFPNDLYNWGLWDEIFELCEKVSYISCHNLSPFMAEHFGVRTGTAIHIPGERQFSALFEQQSPADGRNDTLLHHHQEIIDSLKPERGEVYLVAAGFLGKIYCDVIKNRGGIAIDIGSLADYWMGFATRRYRIDAQSDTGLLNHFIKGHVLEVPTNKERIIGIRDQVRATGNGRYNVAGFDPDLIKRAQPESVSDAALQAAPRLVSAIGHPGCGADVIAAAFRDHGFDVGLDTLNADGVAGWAHAVPDLGVAGAAEAPGFAHRIAFVRNPADALPAVMLENGHGRSLYYRRMHIMRALDVDLGDYRSALDRAVASFVLWYEIVLGADVEAVVRIESAPSTIATLLRTWRSGDAPGSPTTATTPVGSEPAAGPSLPIVDRQAYAAVSAALRQKLEAFCARFEYDTPW